MLKEISKLVVIALMMMFSLSYAYAAVNVIDVTITEDVYQEIKYNPLETGGGLWYDPNENQSVYNPTGIILVENNHPSETIYDVILNFSGTDYIYNLTYSDGHNAIVRSLGSNYTEIYIPDLSAGGNSTLTYNINRTLIQPPLNLTSNYSDTKVFSGLNLGLTDTLENAMNSNNYTNTCIYNISVVQNALQVSQSGEILNFTFENNTIAGSDASNVSFSADNRTLTWNVWNGGCLEATNQTEISYDVETPAGVSVSQYYEFVNTTTSYRLNTSISRLTFESALAVADLELAFEKYQENVLQGDNATWRIYSEIDSFSNITVNLTQVTLWVSERNGTGTGFTNPAVRDNDTVSGADLLKTYNPGTLLNISQNPWNNTGSEWRFNYTFSSSPIVWMDLDNNIVSDGIQITNKSITYGQNEIYIKEVYVATGYWLQISKNITRLADNNYSVKIDVSNLGTSSTPANQVVVVYNFLPVQFNLTSAFVYSSSPWYNTTETNETLNDTVYNGTMYQYGLLPNGNIYNSSLDKYDGTLHQNNTWSVEYNISGSGEFAFDDLFLTGVDPLNVEQYGATKSLSIENVYRVLSGKAEYFLMGVAAIVGVMLLIF